MGSIRINRKVNIGALKANGASAKSISQAIEWNKSEDKKRLKKKPVRKKKEKRPKQVKVFSYGELRIAEFLTSVSVYFEREKKFDGLVGNTGVPLSFDFFIPGYNSIIEYDGIHHFQKTDYSQNLGKVKHYDRLKNKYCKKNKIRLLRLKRDDLKTLKEQIAKFLLDY